MSGLFCGLWEGMVRLVLGVLKNWKLESTTGTGINCYCSGGKCAWGHAQRNGKKNRMQHKRLKPSSLPLPSLLLANLWQSQTGSWLAKEKCGLQSPSPNITKQNVGKWGVGCCIIKNMTALVSGFWEEDSKSLEIPKWQEYLCYLRAPWITLEFVISRWLGRGLVTRKTNDVMRELGL